MTQRTALVTGAAAGIGRAITASLLARGWRVGAFDVDEAALASLTGPDVVTGRMDVRSPADWEAALAAVTQASGGRLDLLVNNAGILQTGRLADIPLVDQQRTVEVNVIGVLNGCHAAHPHLKATPGSQLVNLCSASAIYGQPELAEGGGRLPHRVHRAVGAQAKAMLAASAMSPSWLNRLVNARIAR